VRKGWLRARHRRGRRQPYHRENGGDIIWEIGSLFRLSQRDGSFNRTNSRVSRPTDRSRCRAQGQPGRQARDGGVLPAAKVSEEISKSGASDGEDCHSAGNASGIFDAAGDDRLCRQYAKTIGGKPADQIVQRPSLGISGICKAMLSDRDLSGFHCRRWQ